MTATRKWMPAPTVHCSVCGKLVELNKTHNADPVNDGRCCSSCNNNFVVPERMVQMWEERAKSLTRN